MEAIAVALSWATVAFTVGYSGGRLVEVHLHVDVQGVDHVGDRVGDLLRQRTVLHTGISTVDVSHLTSGKSLAGAVSVYVRIRPLVDGIGRTGTEHELAGSALGVNMEEMGGRSCASLCVNALLSVLGIT